MASSAADEGGFLRRRTAPAPRDAQLKELGLRFFSTLVEHVDYKNAAVLAGPLTSVSDVVCAMPPLHLFSDWSPPRDDPERPFAVEASNAFSTSPDAQKVLEKGASWKAPSGTSSTDWGVKLGARRTVSSLRVEWDGEPESFNVQARDGSGDWSTVEAVDGDAVGSRSRFRLGDVQATHLRLKIEGFAKSNTARTIGIKEFEVFVPDETGVHVATNKALEDLHRWMANAVQSSPESLRGIALRGLTGLALASGSLLHMLRLSHVLFTHPDASIGDDDSTRFLAELEKHTIAERALQTKTSGVGAVGGTGYGEIPGVTFDSSSTGRGGSLTFSESDATVTGGGTAWTCTTWGPITSGKAAWEMRLDRDTTSQCSCFGAIQKPVGDNNYEHSADMWMYRAYNGRHYQNGSTVGSATRRVYQGDTVRMEVDMEAGTMRYIINGEDQGIAFTNLTGKTIWPAVAFYSSSRTVTLVKVEGPTEGGGADASAPADFLSDLPEVSVSGLDQGVLGKGSEMGLNDLKLNVEGKKVNHGLAMIPPRFSDDGEEDATPPHAAVVYALGKKYAKITGKVALNSTIVEEKVSEADTKVVFSIHGDDDALLWESGPVSSTKVAEEFELSLLEVSKLTLRARCLGQNIFAHAVWVDPQVTEVTDWVCDGWVNDKDTFTCAMWGSKRGEPSTLAPVVKEPSAGTHALAQASLEYAGMLANEYMRGMRVAKKSKDAVSPYDLESPFAVEATGECFRVLTELLGDLVKREGALYEKASAGLLRIVRANLRRLQVSRVHPAKAGLRAGGESESKAEGEAADSKEEDDAFAALKPLHSLLMDIADSPSGSVADSVRGEAVDALDAGSDLFVPELAVRKEVLRSRFTPSGVVEVQLSWPLAVQNADGKDVSLDRVLLLLQLLCHKSNIRYQVLGRWPSKIYLVAEITGEKGLTLESFVSTQLQAVFAQAGEKTWTFPVGLKTPELPIKVERLPAWDRKGRLPLEPGIGCVRVYPKGSGDYDEVVASLRAFLPARHLTA